MCGTAANSRSSTAACTSSARRSSRPSCVSSIRTSLSGVRTITPPLPVRGGTEGHVLGRRRLRGEGLPSRAEALAIARVQLRDQRTAVEPFGRRADLCAEQGAIRRRVAGEPLEARPHLAHDGLHQGPAQAVQFPLHADLRRLHAAPHQAIGVHLRLEDLALFGEPQLLRDLVQDASLLARCLVEVLAHQLPRPRQQRGLQGLDLIFRVHFSSRASGPRIARIRPSTAGA